MNLNEKRIRNGVTILDAATVEDVKVTLKEAREAITEFKKSIVEFKTELHALDVANSALSAKLIKTETNVATLANAVATLLEEEE